MQLALDDMLSGVDQTPSSNLCQKQSIMASHDVSTARRTVGWLLVLVASFPRQAATTPLWRGGTVSLYSNYTYDAGFGSGGQEHILSNGAYGLTCSGQPVGLRPLNHTMYDGHHSHLGSFSGINVTLVAPAGAGCGAKDVIVVATFRFFPSEGVVLFTQTFPSGIANLSSAVASATNSGGIPRNLASAFPYFDSDPAADDSLGWLTWSGTFMKGRWGELLQAL